MVSKRRYLGPIEGTRHPQALYLSPDQEVSITPPSPPPPPPPLSGLALSHPGSLDRDYQRTMCETTRPGFASEGGEAFAPIWPYGEVHLPMLALTHQW
jgi:hypothetical protein